MSKLFNCGKQLATRATASYLGAAQKIIPSSTAVAKLQCSSSSSNNFPPPFPGDNSREPHIPPYLQREGESVDTLRARLLYQSRKRGMLENGLLLSTFAAKFLESMSEVELQEYDRLINLPSNDWDIYYWATGVKPIPSEFDTKIMHKFIDHVRNSNRESRLQQPDLN